MGRESPREIQERGVNGKKEVGKRGGTTALKGVLSPSQIIFNPSADTSQKKGRIQKIGTIQVGPVSHNPKRGNGAVRGRQRVKNSHTDRRWNTRQLPQEDKDWVRKQSREQREFRRKGGKDGSGKTAKDPGRGRGICVLTGDQAKEKRVQIEKC